MMMAAALALLASSALIGVLCLTCPKRRRAVGQAQPRQGAITRRWLALAACLPGLVLLSLGETAAFLIWLGGCAVAGWLIALIGGRMGRGLQLL